MPEQPPYLRIADLLRERLLAGEWATGERLPARARLAEEYDVGANVVKRACDVLIAEGLLEGRAGSGTYVPERRARLRMVRSHGSTEGPSFAAAMADLGKRGTWDNSTVAKVPMPPDIAARLEREEGALGVYTRYEFLGDGMPVQLATSWEPYDLTGGTIVVLPEAGPFAGRGVVERMAEIGITVTHATEQLRPRLATPEEKALLGLPSMGTQVTHIQRTYFSDGGRPVETADIVVPEAFCEIVYEVPAKPR